MLRATSIERRLRRLYTAAQALLGRLWRGFDDRRAPAPLDPKTEPCALLPSRRGRKWTVTALPDGTALTASVSCDGTIIGAPSNWSIDVHDRQTGSFAGRTRHYDNHHDASGRW